MSIKNLLIRKAHHNDALFIKNLMSQLKNSQELKTIQYAITKYSEDPSYKFFVAEENNRIVGIITLYISSLYLVPFKKCYI